MDHLEAAAMLTGASRAENKAVSQPTNVHLVTMEAVAASADGTVLVDPGGDVFTPDESQYVEVETVGSIAEGDEVTVLLTGEPGGAMDVLSLGPIGEGDRQDAAIDSAARAAEVAWDWADEAHTAATTAQARANDAAISAENAAQSASGAAASASSAQQSASTAAQAATNAQGDASTAAQAATAAQGSASTAATSAQNAEASASAAASDASSARASASSAQTSATRANTAANDALAQLDTVQDVLGVVQWVAEHGTFAKTTDTTLDPSKVYYVRTGSGTSADPYLYTAVGEPKQADIGSYYELTMDQALSQYVASHLALTDAGLYVLKDASGYRVLLSNTGMSVIDPQGHTVATYGESVTFDSSRPQYIGGEDAYIVYYDADEDGSPDTIRIGGHVLMGGSKTLSEVLAELDDATGVDVVGRNLLVGTSASESVTGNGDSNRLTGSYQMSEYAAELLAGDTTTSLTISFDWTCDDGAGNLPSAGNFWPQIAKSAISGYKPMPVTDGAGHYEVTTHLTSRQASSAIHTLRVRTNVVPSGWTFEVSNVKLERGTKATAWTMAPEDLVGITSTAVTYGTSASATAEPSAWQATPPAVGAGQWLWTRTVTTYTDGSTTTAYSKSYAGTNGTNGQDGRSVTILGSYNTLADLQAAHPTGSLGDGYLVAGDLYVWDGSQWEDVGTIQGPAGQDGTSVTVTSATKADGVTTVTLSDGTTLTIADGQRGEAGSPGDPGADGVGIESITEQWYLSTSSSTQSGGSWGTTQPAWQAGCYIWQRSLIAWTDGSTSTTEPQLANALNGTGEMIYDAQQDIDAAAGSIVSLARGDGTFVAPDGTTVESGIGTTLTQHADAIALRATKTEVQQVRPAYASSTTAAGTKAKVATIDPAVTGYALYKGASVSVTFSTANTAAAPTLNVNSTGAKQIRSYAGAALSESEYKWAAGATLDLVYDGTYWRMTDGGATKRVASAEAAIQVNAENISSKVSATDYNGETIASLINQSADTVTIEAEHIELDGDVVLKTNLTDGTTQISGDNITTGTISAQRISTVGLTIGESQVTGLTGDLAAKANATDVPTKVSDLTNDSGFATTTQAQGYATTAQSAAETTAAADATAKANAAAQTATNYVTDVSNNGIWVTPSDAKPDANGDAIAGTTSGWHIADALELFRAGVSMFKVQVENAVTKVRVGATQLGSNAMMNLLLSGSKIGFMSGTDEVSSIEAVDSAGYRNTYLRFGEDTYIRAQQATYNPEYPQSYVGMRADHGLDADTSDFGHHAALGVQSDYSITDEFLSRVIMHGAELVASTPDIASQVIPMERVIDHMRGGETLFTGTYANTRASVVTLSESAESFSMLRVVCEDSDGQQVSTDIYAPDGKKFSVTTSTATQGTLYVKSKSYIISGTSIRCVSANNVYSHGEASISASGVTYSQSNELIGVVRVIGFR